MKFGRGPISLRLLLTSLAITCGAVPVKTEQVLTPENFKSSIASGAWLVEHFSPYCGHCKAFAPTWEELVKISETEVPGIKLAQVNCAVNGDLCNANGITGYPTLNVYKNGEFVEKFKGNRVLDTLVPYIKRHAVDVPPPSPEYIPNPNGAVAILDTKSFQSTLDQGSTFVKFYAPWCGHCKKLAPTWVKLAKLFQGKLTVAEVDCDANKALCSAQEIEGYPTLVYYSAGGAKTEYTSGRKLEALAAFAEKANAPPSKAIGVQDLDSYITENDIAYVLLHSSHDAPKALTPLFASLLGTPPVYTIADPPEATMLRYGITNSWALLAFKDHDVSTPTSIYTSSSFNADAALKWLLANRLPTTTELTQDSFQSVMKSPAKPLVLLAGVSDSNKELLKQRFEVLSAAWRKREKHDREVVFAWMDTERWKDWMKSMYGISGKSTSLEDVQVVVADHNDLVYWNVDGDGKPIDVLNEKSIFTALEGAASGSIRSIHSENIMERLARYLNTKMTTVYSYVVEHTLQSVIAVFTFLAVIIFALRRWILSDLPDDRYYRDKGRLD
ncbi:thioredoxin-domain-containing protein [Hymenopellis radicata]|nr:thioredoxin-domain-containing protein [Hymenopellis radicata]